MNRSAGLAGLIVLAGVALVTQGCAPAAPGAGRPSPSRGPSLTPLASATVTPTASVTPTPSLTPIASPLETPSPRPSVAPTLPHLDVRFIYHGDRDKPYVALTFDLCQDPKLPAWFDRDIVDALEAHHAPATFFMGGDWMRTHPDETRLLAAHPDFELGNHSWSHPDMRELSEAQMDREIVRTQDLLYQLTGRQSRLFRNPSGFYNDLSLSVLAWHGLVTIQWDVDSADPVPDNDAEMMNGLIRKRVQNGSIILMHANGRGWHTAEALPAMIDYLRGQGYVLVTVPQLIGLDPAPTNEGP